MVARGNRIGMPCAGNSPSLAWTDRVAASEESRSQLRAVVRLEAGGRILCPCNGSSDRRVTMRVRRAT